MARDPYNIFQIFTEILIKELRGQKVPIFIVFESNFQVLAHIKNLLKLINVSQMKNMFIVTEQITKHV